MTKSTYFKTIKALSSAAVALTILSVSAAGQTTTQQTIKGATAVDTQKLSGVVTYVEGNDLVVKLSTGELRTFNVPESRRFLVDGKELTVHDLQPGTSLQATVTTSTTPLTQRTVTNLSGTVWFVNGPNVILTLPDGTNKMYKPKSDVRFKVEGNNATVFDLKKGMKVTAEKIVEEPSSEIASNTQVIGTAPRPKPAPVSAPVQVATAAPAPRPAPVQEVAAAPAPVQAPAVAPEPPVATQLPKTGSMLPLFGALGLLLASVSVVLSRLRRL